MLRKSLLLISALLIFVFIGFLSWLNHNDFEIVLINQTKMQLLITALSEAQSIEKYGSGNDISTIGIDNLVKHINDLEKVYVFIVDDNGKIINCIFPAFVGKDISTLIKGRISASDWVRLNAILAEIKNGRQGTQTLDFFSEDANPKIVKTLIAFAPIRVNKSRYSIIVAMEYNVIAGLVHKNARDNLLFMGFTNLILIIFGVLLYRVHRQKDKLAITEKALNIINKQLHLEIDERRHIQESLMGHFRNKKRKT